MSFDTGVLAFEWARNSFTSALVYSRRTILFFAFLAISISIRFVGAFYHSGSDEQLDDSLVDRSDAESTLIGIIWSL